jgi:hypothetical protein
VRVKLTGEAALCAGSGCDAHLHGRDLICLDLPNST